MDTGQVLDIGATLPGWLTDRKCTAADMDGDAEGLTDARRDEIAGLRRSAEAYLDIYNGDFDFMLSMRKQWVDGAYPLSNAKVSGVLNCLRAEVAFRKRNTRSGLDRVNGGAAG